MFNKKWLPFAPVGIELSDDILDLLVNTSVVVVLDGLSEGAGPESIELGLVVGGKLVQPCDKLSSCLDSSVFKGGFVTGDLGFLVGDAEVELFNDLVDVSDSSGLPAVDGGVDSGFKGIDLSEKSLFHLVDPSSSLFSSTLSESVDFNLGWSSASSDSWDGDDDLVFESLFGGCLPFGDLLFPFVDLKTELHNISDNLVGDFIEVFLVVETAFLFSSSAGLESFENSTVPVDVEWSDTDHLV